VHLFPANMGNDGLLAQLSPLLIEMHKITTEWMWTGWVDDFLSLTHNQLHYYFSLNWIEMGNNL